MTEEIDKARRMIDGATSIAVLTGAGISTDSGIPDFRGPNGKWTLDPDSERLSDINYYKSDPSVRAKTWENYTSGWGSYEPNAGHLALARLHDQGRLLHLATQNIDRLHHAAGVPEDKIGELHGNRSEVRCLGCDRVYETWRWLYANGETGMYCSKCGGLLKPNVVFFGEDLDDIVWSKAVNASYHCDLYLVIGTSLQVWPAAGLPVRARDKGTDVIYVNGEHIYHTRMKRLNLIGSISETLDEIIA